MMPQTILFFLHYALILLFGILLSFAYAGIQLSDKKGFLSTAVLFVVCGGFQLAAYYFFDEQYVWKLYPLVTHVPIILCISLYFKKAFITAFASVTSAYLCCQPAKWIGLLTFTLTQNTIAEQLIRLIVLLAMGYISLHYVAPSLSKLFTKDFGSVCIFGSIPVVYYLFEYVTGIYTALWSSYNQVTVEFIPFILCIFFVVFCTLYYKEYEKKADAERREQLIQTTVQQQQSHIESVKRTEKELCILRHDMRLLLSSLAVCIENNEQQNAKDMIQSYISRIEGTTVQHFCENDYINYVLSDFSSKCKAASIPFTCDVEIGTLNVDEMLFCSILSNALDNALNAQNALPNDKRNIRLMLKNSGNKLLLSVKNTIRKPPAFIDGLPVTNRRGHGLGTQSIRYITETLGGNCQFSAQDEWFVLRVVL